MSRLTALQYRCRNRRPGSPFLQVQKNHKRGLPYSSCSCDLPRRRARRGARPPSHRGSFMQSRIWTASLAVCLFVFNTSASRADDDDRKPHGQAPLEVLVDRLHDPAGIAIAPDGTLYFTETERGTLQRRTPDGTIKQITNRLDKPRGIVITPDGSLLTLADAWRPQSA